MNSVCPLIEFGFSSEKIFLIKRSVEPGCCCSRFRNELFNSSNFGVSMLPLFWDEKAELRYLRARFENIGDNTFKNVFDVFWWGWLEDDDDVCAGGKRCFNWSDDCRVWFWVNEVTGADEFPDGGLLLCRLSLIWRSG